MNLEINELQNFYTNTLLGSFCSKNINTLIKKNEAFIVRENFNQENIVDKLDNIKYNKLLNKDDILKLQSIKLPKTIDMGLLTRTNTITHQCCNNYSEKEKKIIDTIKKRFFEENKS